MHKRLAGKIWVKVIALLIIGTFLFNQTAYARHYTRDKSLDDFFKSDLDQGLMYLAGTVLSIAVPAVMPSFGVAPALVAQSVIVGGGINVASQFAVAAGADPKATMIIGGVAGGLICGGINVYSSGTSLLSNAGLWTMAVNVVPWTASAAASVYAGEKNPALGMLAGVAAGLVSSVGMQCAAKELGGIYFTADGKPLTQEQVNTINGANEAIKNTKLNSGLPDDNLSNNLDLGKSTAPGNNPDLGRLTAPGNNPDLGKSTAPGNNPDLGRLTAPVQELVLEANNIVMNIGDVWRGVNGTPIVDSGFLLGTIEAFRAISPGQWLGLVVSAVTYQALADKGEDPDRLMLANAVSTFAGTMTGELVNQWDGLGKAWSGTDRPHSPWYRQNYTFGDFTESLIKNAIYMGVDYGLGRLNLDTGLSPVTNTFINGSIKFIVGGLVSGTMNSIFLTNENSPYVQLLRRTTIGRDLERDSWEGIVYSGFKLGLIGTLKSTLPIPVPSVGSDAGYNAIMYIQNMTKRFATGADYCTMYAYAFGTNLENVATSQLSSSIGSAIFDRDTIFFGRFRPGAFDELSHLSTRQLQDMFHTEISSTLTNSNDLERIGIERRIAELARINLNRLVTQGLIRITETGARVPLEGFEGSVIVQFEQDKLLDRYRVTYHPLQFTLTNDIGRIIGLSAAPRLLRVDVPFDARLPEINILERRYAEQLRGMTLEQQRNFLLEALRTDYNLPNVDVLIERNQQGQDVLRATLATPAEKGRVLDIFSTVLTQELPQANPELDPTRLTLIWSMEPGDTNTLFIMQNNTLPIRSLTVFDYFGRPAYSLYYRADNDRMFNLASEAYWNRFRQRSGLELPIDRNRPLATAIREALTGTYGWIVSGFMDTANPIDAPIQIARGSVFYYGYMGKLNLTETTQLYIPQVREPGMPYVSYGRELLFYGYTNDRLSDQLRYLDVRGNVRMDLANFTYNQLARWLQDMVPERYRLTQDNLINLRTEEAQIAFILDFIDYINSFGPEIITAHDQEEILGTNDTEGGLIRNRQRGGLEAAYARVISCVQDIWVERDNLARLESLEKFAVVETQDKTVIIPEWALRAGYRQGENTPLWAVEDDRGIYQQLGRGLFEGKPVLTYRGNILETMGLGQAGFVVDGVEIRTSPQVNIVDINGYQLIECQGRYFGAYSYNTLLNPRYSGWSPYQEQGYSQRPVTVQYPEIDYGRGSVDIRSVYSQGAPVNTGQGRAPEVSNPAVGTGIQGARD